jgi:uncharacterized protein (DUF2147 family)
MKSVYALVLLGTLVCPLRLFAQSPVGVWIDKDKDTFELYGQGTIGGKIRSLNPPTTPDGKTLTDIHNPDPSKRKIPLVGSVFLENFKPEGHGLWDHGTVYDARSGRTYSCTIQMQGNDALDLHGYYGVSILGRTEHWKRVIGNTK